MGNIRDQIRLHALILHPLVDRRVQPFANMVDPLRQLHIGSVKFIQIQFVIQLSAVMRSSPSSSFFFCADAVFK